MTTRKPPVPPKRVYVLGAGFSYGAGYPLQRDVLHRIESLGIMDAPVGPVERFINSQATIVRFLAHAFPKDMPPSLEDLFTLLDQTIDTEGYFAGRSWENLNEVRDQLKRAVLFLLHAAGEAVPTGVAKFYRSIAAHLVSLRLAAGQENDSFSIISLNWDTLLEDSIYWCIHKMGVLKKVDVDYCCYTTPFDTTYPHTPSILQRAKRIFNIKVLKLHGSANWLRCPNCNRLFTGLGRLQNVWDEYVEPRLCPNCQQQSVRRRQQTQPYLEPFFITPTFVKVFDNAHIQMIWHNAYVELAEATEVVFIGYSLPEADYHLRTLLRRAINPDASIVVVLTKHDRPHKNTDDRLRRFLASSRYKGFFGEKRVKFNYSGTQGYFEEVLDIRSLRSQLKGLREQFRKTFRK